MSPVASIASALLVTVTAACSGPSRPAPVDDPTGPNTLTAGERAAGWRLLFDGRSTAGWRGFRQAAMPAGWEIADGALTRVGGGGDIVTVDEFANFELALEWRIAPGGNSGIMYRVSEADDATYFTGPEMQVLDNAGHPDGRSPLSSAGACYGMYPPASDATRPVGSWNDVRIVAIGPRVEHWLNGTRIVEYEIGSADWLMRLQASPFRDLPRYGRESRGRIALQDHGDRVAYRSVKIQVR
jgi:3-keto-disaccharide hydrolase